jgi:hypothetical protein
MEQGIKIKRYSNHARMYVENGLTDKEIFPVYSQLHDEFKDKCINPVIVFYKCWHCGKWESHEYPCYCKGYYGSPVDSKYSCK